MEKDLTIVVITKNEENNLPRCLKSLEGLGKILVVDDFSDDKTVEIAKNYKAEVFKRKLDNFAAQRNFSLEKVKTKWVLLVDADEEVTDGLKTEIKRSIKSTEYLGFKIPRKNIIFDKWIEHAGWYPDFQLHLFQTKKGKYERQVHERVKIEGNIGELKENLIHYNYQTVSQYLEKLFKYTSLEAENLKESGYSFEWSDLIRKPFNEFLRRYFAEQGFKDGIHGLALSILQGFYEFIVYLKIWEKENFVEKEITAEAFSQLNKSSKELNYWIDKEEKNLLKKFLHKIL